MHCWILISDEEYIMVKVITYGTYDLLHYGHIRLLERAKALGDYLIVGVTSDDYDITRGKINNQQSLMERVEAIKATGIADEIIIEEYEGQKIDDIRRLEIDIFTVGSDWEGKFDYLNEYCKVVYLPRTEGISSSELRTEKRSVRIYVEGESAIGNKFVSECQFVNGIEICNKEDSSAVYIVSAPDKHYQQVKEAIAEGKNVICEAPIAIKEEQTRELIELANQKNLVLFEGIKTAFSTAYARLLLLAKSGRIGKVLSVDATCTSMRYLDDEKEKQWGSLCAWGPTALLPVFQLLGTDYSEKHITTWQHDNGFDGFTKIDFRYPNAVASIKVAKAAKAEGELIITGTKGYIYVPAPWWKTDYFEVRYEDPNDNKRYFYQLDGEGLRYEIVAFVKSIESKQNYFYIDPSITIEISRIMDDYFAGSSVNFIGVLE